MSPEMGNRKRCSTSKIGRSEKGPEKAMAPHSSTLAWKIPRMEEPGGLQSMGLLKSDMTERLHFHFSLSCIGEGNGNPLQCSCLENPRDGGARCAAVYGVAQSQTRLKWLSSSISSSSRERTRHEWGTCSVSGIVETVYLIPVYRWEAWGSECGSDLLRFKQGVRGSIRIRNQVLWFPLGPQSMFSSHEGLVGFLVVWESLTIDASDLRNILTGDKQVRVYG